MTATTRMNNNGDDGLPPAKDPLNARPLGDVA